MTKIAMFVFNSFTNDSRVLKEATSLQEHHFDVTVIAHKDVGVKEEESIGDLKIRRFSYLDRKITTGTLGKLKAYLVYVKESIAYCKDFDILHCHDLNTLPIGFIIKKFFNKNVKIVYDAHEHETEIRDLVGTKQKFTKIIEKFLIKSADKVITVSNAIAEDYARLYNIPKPALVLNTPPYQEIDKKDIFRKELGIDKNQTIFLYQGGFSAGRGIEILLEAFQNIQQDADNHDFQPCIVFMGYGPLEELVINTARKYNDIYFYPAVTPDVLLDYTSSADFGILFYENNCLNHDYCSPNKMFEYLMADIPVIASNLYEMKRLVQNNKIGIVAEENTANGLKEAIIKATTLDKEELRKNIQKIKNIYNWEEQEKVLLTLYKELEK
jgi:glycosyltransferase involved in cell wall biosynthesis